MRTRASRLSVAGVLLLLAGCPDDAVPTPPRAPGTPTTTPTPSAPAQLTTEGAGAPSADRDVPAPTLVTVTPPEPPGVGDRVRLGSGHLLTATPALRVGGAGVRDGLAQLEVLIGAWSYSVEAAPGDVIAVGPASLAIDEVDGTSPGVAVVRWEREAPAEAPLLLKPRPYEHDRGVGLLLREQALYELGGGAHVGVGDVRETPDGPRVTLTIFPGGYEADPGAGYSRDVRIGAGALVGVGGPGPRFRVARVTARSAEQRWGTVVLAPP